MFKKLSAAILLTFLLASSFALAGSQTASAASSCGSKSTSREYGVNIPLVGYKAIVTHNAKTRSCEDDRIITSNGMEDHGCKKTLIAFVNSTTKRNTIGRAGGPESSSNYQCDFYGGLIWKGVGIGVTREMYITHRAYINSGALWFNIQTGLR